MKRTIDESRKAFTLIETLLVMALIIVLLSMAYPALKGPLDNHRLRKGAETLRAEWARGRNRAMLRGKALEFTYLPESADYQFAESQTMNDASAFLANFGTAAEAGTQSAPPSPGLLPEGVFFVAPKIPLGSRVEDEEISALENGWEGPITFYPDGTADDAEVTLTNERGAEITVSLRGLTGGTTSSDVLQPDRRAR